MLLLLLVSEKGPQIELSRVDVSVLDQFRWLQPRGSVSTLMFLSFVGGGGVTPWYCHWGWCFCPWPGSVTSWFCHAVGLMFLSMIRGGDIQQHGSTLRTQRRACRLRPRGVQTHLSGRGTRRHPRGCRGAVWSHQRGLRLRLRGHWQRRHRQRQQGHRWHCWGEGESHKWVRRGLSVFLRRPLSAVVNLVRNSGHLP